MKISKLLFDSSTISLRQQEKIFSHARIALRSFNANNYVVPMVYLLLTYIKVIDDRLYNEIKNKSLSIEQLQAKFHLIFKNNITDEVEWDLMRLEAYLIMYYNNFIYSIYNRDKIYSKDNSSEKKLLLIKSAIRPENEEAFLRLFQGIDSKRGVVNFDMNHFFKRIDLTESIRI